MKNYSYEDKKENIDKYTLAQTTLAELTLRLHKEIANGSLGDDPNEGLEKFNLDLDRKLETEEIKYLLKLSVFNVITHSLK